MLGVEVDREEASKFGTFVRDGTVGGLSSGTPNDIMSTMLETSFAILSGSFCGKSLPTIFKLHKYMAKANSGNRSCPDLVVSDRTLARSVYSLVPYPRNIPYVHQVTPRKL